MNCMPCEASANEDRHAPLGLHIYRESPADTGPVSLQSLMHGRLDRWIEFYICTCYLPLLPSHHGQGPWSQLWRRCSPPRRLPVSSPHRRVFSGPMLELFLAVARSWYYLDGHISPKGNSSRMHQVACLPRHAQGRAVTMGTQRGLW